MKQRKNLRRGAAMLLLSVVLVLTVAATQGSETDPLVTLGYLTEQFLPKVVEQVNAKAVERDKTLEGKLQAMVNTYASDMEQKINKALSAGGAGTASSRFATVNLSAGQTLIMEAGGELLFRAGIAGCIAPSSPGLVDTTAGATLEQGGAFIVNHLYLATDQGRGVSAVDAVTVLVRGGYTVT